MPRTNVLVIPSEHGSRQEHHQIEVGEARLSMFSWFCVRYHRCLAYRAVPAGRAARCLSRGERGLGGGVGMAESGRILPRCPTATSRAAGRANSSRNGPGLHCSMMSYSSSGLRECSRLRLDMMLTCRCPPLVRDAQRAANPKKRAAHIAHSSLSNNESTLYAVVRFSIRQRSTRVIWSWEARYARYPGYPRALL